MSSYAKPTSDQINKARSLLGSVEKLRYFFSRLENPEWLVPLSDAGFFASPPSAEALNGNDGIRFLPWAQSQWIAKIASRASDPRDVAKVIHSIPDTDNSQVHRDLLEALAQIPAEHSQQFAQTASGWLQAPYFRISRDACRLALNCAEAGFADAAQELLLAVFEVVDPSSNQDPRGARYHFPPDPIGRVDSFEYGELLAAYSPDLVRAMGVTWLGLLGSQLEKAVAIHCKNHQGQTEEDLSLVWRPSIAEHEQNLGNNVLGALVSATRDAAVVVPRLGIGSLESVQEILLGFKWKVFRRIWIHTATENRQENPNLARSTILDWDSFKDTTLRCEYFRAIEVMFSDLSASEKEQFLGWVDGISDLATKETGLTGDQLQEYIERRQLDWLMILRNGLPESWQRRRAELIDKFGEAERADMPFKIEASSRGFTSPFSAEDLSQRNCKEVLALLSQWTVPSDIEGPSVWGFASAFRETVKSRPSEFLEHLDLIERLRPTYVRAFLGGLGDSALTSEHPSLSSLLEMCARSASPSCGDPPLEPHDLESTGELRELHRETIRFIEGGLQQGEQEFPLELRTRIWAVLELLARSPNPSHESQQLDAQSGWDPLTESINSVHGSALHASVKYGLWMLRALRERGEWSRGREVLPELFALLDERLDPSVDPSLAIRAVYGQWFPWLSLLDQTWATERVDSIFPTNESGRMQFLAAWGTYITYVRPYDDVFELLQPKYQHSVANLERLSRGGWKRMDIGPKLAEHLILLTLRGRVPLDVEGSLLRDFYQVASPSARAHATGFVGRSFKRSQSIDKDAVQVAMTLWDMRFESIRKDRSACRDEAREFGWWFVCSAFDRRWALERLERVLNCKFGVRGISLVVEKLADSALDFPRETLSCMRELVETVDEEWRFTLADQHLLEVLEIGVASDDPAVVALAHDLVNNLGHRGIHKFRHLLG